MEAIRPYTTHVMPSLKPVNFNYFPLVKNVLKEGLLEHEHIALNTTIYYVTKQQIDNWKFSHKPTTIGLHKQSCKPWKKHSADRQQQNNCLFAHQSYSDPPPPQKKKTREATPPPTPRKLSPFGPPPSLRIFVALRVLGGGGGGGGGGYGYFLKLHIIPDITKTSSNNCLIFTSVSVDSSPRSYLSTSATVRIPVHTATKSGRNLSCIYWRIHFQYRCSASSQCYRNRTEITVL